MHCWYKKRLKHYPFELLFFNYIVTNNTLIAEINNNNIRQMIFPVNHNQILQLNDSDHDIRVKYFFFFFFFLMNPSNMEKIVFGHMVRCFYQLKHLHFLLKYLIPYLVHVK